MAGAKREAKHIPKKKTFVKWCIHHHLGMLSLKCNAKRQSLFSFSSAKHNEVIMTSGVYVCAYSIFGPFDVVLA